MTRARSFRIAVRVLAAAMVLTGCDWADLGFGPAGTSENAFEPAITTTSVAHLAVAWSQPCTCGGRTLVVGGHAFTVDHANNGSTAVRAFDAAQGAPQWSTPVTDARLMAAGNGLVYVISASQSVVALDAGSGVTRWTLHPPVPGSGTVTVSHLVVDGPEAFVDGTSAIGNANPVSEISAVDPSGHVLWSTTPGGQVGGFAGIASSTQADSAARALQVVSLLPSSTFGTPLVNQYDEAGGGLMSSALSAPNPAGAFNGIANVAASGGLVYFNEPGVQGLPAAGLFAVEPGTGARVWSGFGNQSYAVSPKIVVSVDEDRGEIEIEGLDARTGGLVWAAAPTGTIPAIVNGVVLSTVGALQARDLSTGAVVATFNPTGDNLTGDVTAADGHIYAGSATRLYALAPTSRS